MSEQNTADGKALLRHVFAETAKGNGVPFVEALADDVCWIIPGTSSWSREYLGKRTVIDELLTPLRRIFDGPNRVEALRIFGEGDQFVVEARGNVRTRDGVIYRNGYCWICRIADGRIAELVEYADTALMDFALGPPGQA